MIKFKYEGPMRVGFADIGREIGPGEEFDVPEQLALNFDAHGHCTCLEPEKLAPLRAAAEAAQAEQDRLRAASGLVNAHPYAPQQEPEKDAAATEAPTSAPVVDQPAPEPPGLEPAPSAPKRAAKADPPATAK